ncbi:hypothetical protein [Microbacterium sp. NPDC055455]
MAAPAELRRRSFKEDIRALMLAGTFLAAMVWAVSWLPLSPLLILGQPFDTALQNPWLSFAREVGPVTASAVDPLLPTLVTVLVALSISEIWRVAPEELLRLGSLLALVGIAWAALALTSLVTAPGEATGQAIAGSILALVFAITAGWMRHVSPVGLRSQLEGLSKAEATLANRRDRYRALFNMEKLEVANPRRARLLWFAPVLVTLFSTLPASLAASSPEFVALIGSTTLGVFAIALYGLGTAVKDPVRGDDTSARFARTSAGLVSALLTVTTVLLAIVNMAGVAWYWAILSASGAWTVVSWRWAMSPYVRTFLMANRTANAARLRRVIETRAEVEAQLARVNGVSPDRGRLTRALREFIR